MNQYVTSITAVDPKDGQLKEWGGPNVPGITQADAERYCQQNGLGYCRIDGILVAEIPCREGTYEPDWNKMVDFENTNLN